MLLETTQRDFDMTSEDSIKIIENYKTYNFETVNYVEKRITTVLLSIGISGNLQGYHFIKSSIKLVMQDPQYINYITKKLYPKVAEIYATSAIRVERAIRHALESAYSKGKLIYLNSVLGMDVITRNEKPTNSEFIAIMADILNLETN